MNTRSLLTATLALLLATSVLLAHHSVTAVFDTSKKIKLSGELTEVDWVNPHIFLHLKMMKGNAVEQWKVEGGPPAWYRRVGASSGTFTKRIGETVIIDGLPAKDGSLYGYLQKITFADGDSLESTSAAEASQTK